MKERLLGSSRDRRRDEGDDEPLAAARRPAPAKLTTAEVREQPAATWQGAAPGKLTLADVGRDAMSPEVAIRGAIDRRAESDSDDDGGSLGTAFAFLDESRGGVPLPASLRARLERELRVDLSRVRLHVDDRAAEAARALHARAFTIGEDIYFAAGAYDPSGGAGVELIAHEVAHVAQNLRGAAKGAHQVSQPGDAHEREAEAFARRFMEPVEHVAGELREMARAAITVSRDAIDRAGGGTAATRVKDFVDKLLKSNPIKDYTKPDARPDTAFGVLEAKSYPIRYVRSQAREWKEGDYKGSKDDLQAIIDGGGTITGTQLRLHRVGTARSKRYVLTRPGGSTDAYRPVATALDPEPKWKKAYLGDGTRGISAVPKAADKMRWGAQKQFEAWDPAVSEDELGAYRDGLEVVLSEHFARKPGHWHDFYEQVVLGPAKNKADQRGIFPHPYKRIVGNVFEKLVAESTRDEDEFKVDATQVAIFKKNKKGEAGMLTSIADGTIKLDVGRCIVETKAWTQPPGKPERDQAKRYRAILDKGTNYVLKNGEDVEKVDFGHIVYVFVPPTQDKWKSMLDTVFGHDPAAGTDYTQDMYSVVPPYKGHVPENFQIGYNPTFEFPARKGATHVHLHDPQLRHNGLRIVDLDVQLEDGVVTSGHVTDAIDMHHGALKTKPKRKKIEIVDGAARVPQQFREVEGKIDKILGDRIHPVARVTNEGVEAGITISPGKSGIPGFELTHGELTVTYGNDNTFGVRGGLGLARKVNDGVIRGDLTVSYSGNDWVVTGDVEITKGVIDGLDTFTAELTYAGGEVTIAVGHAKYSKDLGGVHLEGDVRALEYDTHSKKFSGRAEITADLGPFGKASALAEMKNSQIERAELSYDTPELVFPKGSASPVLRGTVGGTIIYDHGKLSGHIRGDAKLALAGMKAADEAGKEVGLEVDARIGHDGKFSGTVAGGPLVFGKHFRIPRVEGTIDEHGNMSATVIVQLDKIKGVERATMTFRIDEHGITPISGGITIKFGDEKTDKVWGTASADYAPGEGLVVAGEISTKIKDGMIGTGWMSYSTKTGTGKAGIKVSRIPILQVDDHVKKLIEFDKQIILASLYGIVDLFLDTRFTLELHYGMTLGLTPEVEVDGIDLENLSFQRAVGTVAVDGDLGVSLTAAPGVGLGLAILHPDLLSGKAGIEVPITAGAHINPTTTLQVAYDKDGGLETAASLGLALSFGITGEVVAYAGLNVLMGAWEPSWREPLKSFTIMEPKELFNWTLDLGGDIKKHEPTFPAGFAPPARPAQGTRTIPQETKPGTPPKQEPPAQKDAGADTGLAGIAQLKPLLKQIPHYAELESILEEAVELWEDFKGVIDDIKGAIKSGARAIKNAATWVGGKAWEGLELVGGAVVAAGEAVGDAAEWGWDHTGGALYDEVSSWF